MIGHLQGTVLSISTETAIILVSGVGYEIHAMPRLLDRLTKGEAAAVFIETMVREDFIKLYAFADEAERHCFRLLQSVQGVGAKAALSILQVLTPAMLLDALSVEDHAVFARAQGVGKKIATRIVTELSGKTPDLMVLINGHTGLASTLSTEVTSAEVEVTSGKQAETGGRADAVSALVNLGYDSMIARQAVGRAAKEDPSAGVQDLIRTALKELSKL